MNELNDNNYGNSPFEGRQEGCLLSLTNRKKPCNWQQNPTIMTILKNKTHEMATKDNKIRKETANGNIPPQRDNETYNNFMNELNHNNHDNF